MNYTAQIIPLYDEFDRNLSTIMAEKSALRKRSITIAGHGTSVSLENAFWDALKELAKRRRVSVNTLISEIDQERTGNLSSAIRVFVLEHMRYLSS